MVKTLINRLKRAGSKLGLGLGLTACALGFNGCETPEQTMLAGTMLKTAAIYNRGDDPRAVANAMNYGDALQMTAMMQAQERAAIAGRSEVNVYVQPQGQANASQGQSYGQPSGVEPSKSYLKKMFETMERNLTVSKWVDTNKNGDIDSGDYFESINSFLEEDTLVIIGSVRRGQHNQLFIEDVLTQTKSSPLCEKEFEEIKEPPIKGKLTREQVSFFDFSFGADTLRKIYTNPYTIFGERKYDISLVDANTGKVLKTEPISVYFRDIR